MRESNRRKTILFYGLFSVILIGFTAILIVGLEFTLSFFVARPSDSMERNFRLNHTWPAGKTNTYEPRQPDRWPGSYTHHYNRQSWIETYDIEPTKPAGTYRIFYVGDSHTEGLLPMDRSVASQVETELNRRFADSGHKFEVINTGTTSYSPIIYYILIRYFISQYDPDVVVINVDMTDNFDDWKYRRTTIFDEDGNPYAAPARNIYDDVFVQTRDGVREANWYNRLNLFLFHKSYTYNWILQSKIFEQMTANALKAEKEARAEEKGRADNWYEVYPWAEQHEWEEETEENVAFTLDMLRRTIEFANENGIKIALTGVPYHYQFTPDEKHGTLWSLRPFRELKKVTEAGGAIYFDSYGPLKEKIFGTEWTRYYYLHNIHLNPDGNDLWARVHIDTFLDPANKLLPPDLR